MNTLSTHRRGPCVFAAALALGLGLAGAASASDALSADLFGGNEVPPVETDAFGRASIDLDAERNQIRLDLVVSNTAPITRIHIHQAPAGANGGVVVFFFDNVLDDCLPSIGVGDCSFLSFVANGVDGDLIEAIGDNPQDFYVNVHSELFPPGELRGQLFRPERIELDLEGEQEVPPVDTDASGRAEISIDEPTGDVAIFIDVEDITDVTRVHIHAAEEGSNGPIVVNFFDSVTNPGDEVIFIGGDGKLGFQVNGVSADLVDDLLNRPEAYYVNVHSNAFPAGELRGQLAFAPDEGDDDDGDDDDGDDDDGDDDDADDDDDHATRDVRGDVNGDGRVDIRDLVLVLKKLGAGR